jgi:hypothetical protein
MRIVADGAIASGAFGDGRLIPALIIDASTDPSISELVRVHQFAKTGDVTHAWGKPHGSVGKISLMLWFDRPFEFSGIIEFEIEKQGPLVDQIIMAKSLYIFAGKPGDRMRDQLPGLSVLIEIVTDSDFLPKWDSILRDSLYKRFKKAGLSRSGARVAAEGFLVDWRGFGKLRVPPIVKAP